MTYVELDMFAGLKGASRPARELETLAGRLEAWD